MGNFTFENQGANTFLVYTIEDDQALDSLNLGMQTNNRIEGLVPLIYMQMDQIKYLKYNISSKVSLQQYFQGMVAKRQFLTVFYSIAKTMLLIEEYMILPGSILFDMDRIYVDVSNSNAELISLPLMDKNACVDLGKFFKNIVFSIRFDQNENCDYVTKIINYLNSTDHFSLLEFEKLLQEMLEGQYTGSGGVSSSVQHVSNQPPVQQQPQAGGQSAQQQSPNRQMQRQYGNHLSQIPNQPQSPQLQNQQQQIQFNRMSQQAAEKNGGRNQSLAGNQMKNTSVKKSRFRLFGKKDKKQKQNNSMANPNGMPTSNQGGMPIPNQSGMPMPNRNEMMTPNPNRMSVPNPNGMPISNPNGMPVSNPNRMQIPGQGSRNVQTNSRMQSEKFGNAGLGQGQPGMGSMNIPGQNQGIPQQKNIAPIGIPLPQKQQKKPVEAQPAGHVNFGETIVLSQGNGAGETTVLSEHMQQTNHKPYLVRIKTNEKIPVSKDLFKLGKEISYADYCITDNSAVSRSHANLITREQKYFLIDTNSKNHTFIDGMMIQPNTEYQLSDGCRVRLANEEFEFHLQ